MRSILGFGAVSTIFVLLLFPGVVGAEPRLAPDPFVDKVGSMSEPLEVESLIETALRISGADEQRVGSGINQIEILITDAHREIADSGDVTEIGEQLLVYLHDRVFTNYDEFQTRIDTILDTGRFNCVSSAVLYMILARSFDLPITGVGTADHAFCAVVTPERTIDVETTTVHGFDPGKKKEFQDSFGNVTGYSYVPPSNYSGRTQLGEKDLLALILQNRISLLETQKRYGEAVGLAVDRYALARSDVTRLHLAREMANYAALLN